MSKVGFLSGMWLHRLEASICELVIDFVVGGPLDETIILILAKDSPLDAEHDMEDPEDD